MATILYFGDTSPESTSAQRASTLRRLGHTVAVHNPFMTIGQLGYRWREAFHFRTGYRFMQAKVARWVQSVLLATPPPDLIWVDSGELLGPASLQALRALGCPVVLFNLDDPTGPRDGRRFASLLPAIQFYDLVVVVRRETEAECRKLGAGQVLRLLRGYDEVAHAPFADLADVPAQFRSEVAFIGTWMRHERRDEFLLDLINQGIPLSIWGERWEKSPFWAQLKTAYRGRSLSGRDYVAAIQGSKICLGLLSKGNRDLHTQRSLEVPFAGGLLCAERTSEHQEIYQEGEEAVFWSNADECAQVCKKLLQDDVLREKIRLAGGQRARALKVGNEDICRRILSHFNVSEPTQKAPQPEAVGA